MSRGRRGSGRRRKRRKGRRRRDRTGRKRRRKGCTAGLLRLRHPPCVPDQEATHAAASIDFEGKCYDEEKLLSFGDAESFLTLNKPGI
ncbi:unnamed protein product [Ectocarpus sp. 13 AM-2016]